MTKFNNFANNFRGLIKSGSIGSSGVNGAGDVGVNPNAYKAQSFETRQHIERSRSKVGAYRDSGVMTDYRQAAKYSDKKGSSMAQKLSVDSALENDLIPLSNRQKMKFAGKLKNQRQESNARWGQAKGAAIPKRSFQEPKSRYK